MDCAAKFEKNVVALPGVSGARLNTATGRLTVEGVADLESIRQEGKKENYTIYPQGEAAEQQKSRVNWDLVRTVISALFLLAGYILEQSGSTLSTVIPLYLIAMVCGGWGNFRKAFFSLRKFDFNMSVLMSAAIIGAIAISQWEEGAVVAFLYTVSEMLESWTMARARKSIRELMDIAPKEARVVRNNVDVKIPVEEIRVGDVVVVLPGEKIPMDGTIGKGETAINQAAITGESVPMEKGPGDEVFAGTLNTHGALEIRVTKLVKDTTIAKIIHLVEEAQTKRAKAQAFVDRFAAVYTPIVLALAVAIVLFPPLLLGYAWRPWIYRGLALLVVSCPCALVVSTPVALVSAISNAARNGVLIKGGTYLEQAGSLRAIAFDKTGTLTKGEPAITDIIALNQYTNDQVLQLAANLETRSEHPLALAIVKEAKSKGILPEPIKGFSALAGRGAQGISEGKTFYIGNSPLYVEKAISTELITQIVDRLQAEGKTALIIGSKESLIGVIAVADRAREISKTAVSSLKRMGIHPVMLTGDNNATAQAIAKEVGVEEFQSDLLPKDKVSAVQNLLNNYGTVAMVGDGINDAPALATATVGIAMGGAGTDTALETADITLMADDLTKLPFTIALSQAALRVIKQNIGFSLFIKVVAVIAVFPGWLTLWLAILADMGASILVTLNGIRLLRIKPDRK